jgi:Nucleotidyl transferase AbiEii toxin, Type IV TA system
VLDRRLVEQVAGALGTGAGLVEKDWHVIRALGVLAALDLGDMQPVFSGGTSLSAAWGLIKRFSEDVDFKVAALTELNSSRARTSRRDYREKVLAAFAAADFELIGAPLVGNESRYFSADFAYHSEFATAPGLRPHLRVELTFQAPALPSIKRPIQSLLARAQKRPPEIQAFPCVDPVETAADKLSATCTTLPRSNRVWR